MFRSTPRFFALSWISSAACNKNQRCSGGFGQRVTHSSGTKFHGKELCGTMVNKNSVSPSTALHAFALESNLQGNEVRDGDDDDNSK